MDAKPANPDLHRINMTRDTDIAFWCRVLNVSAQQLRDAVQHAGPQAEAVRRYLQEKQQPAG